MSKRDKGMVDRAKSAVGKAAEVAGQALGAAEKAAGAARQAMGGRMNRTGIELSPVQGREIIEGARGAIPSSPGDVNALGAVRASYAVAAEPAGTAPPPATMKGMAASAMAAARGDMATFLLDKLGERLAFERSGVRLYEALLLLFDAHGGFEGGPTRAQLETIRREEAEHFLLVKGAIEGLGGDPTAVTPSANRAGVEAQGLLQVLTDPRSRLADGLHAILIAELTDHDGWDMLVDVAVQTSQDALVPKLRAALVDEEKHLGWVRDWLLAHGRTAGSMKGWTANQDQAGA